MKQFADYRISLRMLCNVGLVMFLSLFGAFGQESPIDYRKIDEKFSEVWNRSETLRKTYSWYAKTEVIRNEETVNTRIEQYSHDRNGSLLSNVISEEQAELPSFILIRQLAEASKDRLVAFMNGLKVFLEQYALTDDKIRHTFFARAAIGIPDEDGMLRVSGRDVFTEGDKLTWWIDTNTYTITRAYISTIFEDTQVDFDALYNYLPTGMNYMTLAEIMVPDKDLLVKLKFYDYQQKK